MAGLGAAPFFPRRTLWEKVSSLVFWFVIKSQRMNDIQSSFIGTTPQYSRLWGEMKAFRTALRALA